MNTWTAAGITNTAPLNALEDLLDFFKKEEEDGKIKFAFIREAKIVGEPIENDLIQSDYSKNSENKNKWSLIINDNSINELYRKSGINVKLYHNDPILHKCSFNFSLFSM